ncbi:sulfurtransferase-like selenium metabolism protein YedF [Thermosulfurimonas sp.]|uniref:sulfurtransferase-like selenium metabolism protein YedF n=1 Tax=Thermosulfurimonas sp. TaxID=2080236 RepID=UPI0025CF537E|nr:sulfurtransferase-like selenium metabolism protein YedF [Thermosulfurimonas sp.]
MREIDCRGLACPQPVLETKEALEGLSEGEVLRVLVDNEAAVQNVSRFVSSQGYPLQVKEEAGYFILEVVKKGSGRPVEGVSCERPEGIFRVILVDSDRMGEGDEELGRKLLLNFLRTLPQVSPLPQALVFYNRGVFLTVEGSPVLSVLRELEEKGVKIFSCWTCLSHYDLEDKLRVGQASNMYEILSLLMRADRVLRP